MKATIVDLRYKMKKVLKALELNEEVTILYRGKVKGKIVPSTKDENEKKVKDHPFFGMNSEKEKSVLEELDDIRSSRVNDI